MSRCVPYGTAMGVGVLIAALLAACGATTSEPTSVAPQPPQCDASLWSHVHDPSRLHIVTSCVTVTGTVMSEHSNADGDGDIDMQVALDPAFTNLLNSSNQSKLNGYLQVEAVCQAPVKARVPDAVRACQGFTGSVFIPPVGMHVQITGTYVLDANHGWMEIHPVTVMTPTS